jgi:hypothetical protein
MSATNEKKSLRMLAMALVVALTISGALLTYAGEGEENPDADGESSESLEINLYKNCELVTEDSGKAIINVSAGDVVPRVINVKLGDESPDAYVRVKVETAVTLGGFQLTGQTSEAAQTAYFSKFAAALFTVRDGLKIGAPDKWYFEFDPTDEEKTTIAAILKKDFSDGAAPSSITITGYLYYYEMDESENVRKLATLTTGTAINANNAALKKVAFPAYQTKTDFMTLWDRAYSSWQCDTDDSIVDFLSDTDTSQFFDMSAGEDGNDTDSYAYASKYPLTSTTLAIKLLGEAVTTDQSDTKTIGEGGDTEEAAKDVRDYFVEE